MDTEESHDSTRVRAARSHWLAAFDARAHTLGLLSTQETLSHDLKGINTGTQLDILDAEVDGLRSALGAALTTRNRLSMWDNLPAEIFGYIFMELSKISPMRISSDRRHRMLGWVTVTHVSRRWRSVAIDYTALWSTLAFDTSQPWRIYLKRSKNTPLIIRGDWGDDSGDLCFAHVCTVSPRIQTLSLANVSLYAVMKLHRMLKNPHPSLRTLSIRTIGYHEYSGEQLAPEFMSSIVPNLVHLRLESMGLPTGANCYLRSLQLRHALSHTPPRGYTFSDILSTLRQLPALELLSLENMVPRGESDCDANAELVSLLHLKLLSIKDSGRLCIDLWAYIDTSLNSDIAIYSTEGDDGPPTQPSILLPLARRAHMYLDDDTLPSMTLEFDFSLANHSLSLTSQSSSTFAVAPDIKQHYAPMSLKLSVPHVSSNVLFKSLAVILPHGLVGHIRLVSRSTHIYFPVNASDMGVAWADACSVSSLELHGTIASTALTALHFNGEQMPLLPNLRHLHLKDVRLCHHTWVYDAGESSFDIFDILKRALDDRYFCHGLSLESISLEGCQIMDSSVAWLKAAERWGGQTRVSVS